MICTREQRERILQKKQSDDCILLKRTCSSSLKMISEGEIQKRYKYSLKVFLIY